MSRPPASSRHGIDRLLVAVGLLWAFAIAAGLWRFERYTATPGPGASAPSDWPEGVHVVRAADRPTLVVFIHPHCPCSRASLAELAALAAALPAPPAIRVVFVIPPGVEPGWDVTPIGDLAAAIPGATVVRDENGVDTRRFGARTSGQVLLYDEDGRLRFRGGLTPFRGERGANAGVDRLRALLEGRAADAALSPVFGCALLEAE